MLTEPQWGLIKRIDQDSESTLIHNSNHQADASPPPHKSIPAWGGNISSVEKDLSPTACQPRYSLPPLPHCYMAAVPPVVVEADRPSINKCKPRFYERQEDTVETPESSSSKLYPKLEQASNCPKIFS